MKYAFVALALAALAQAQTRADIPDCALPCLDDAIEKNTECATTDYACVCKNFDAVQGDATGCVLKACGTETAINKVLPATKALCSANSGPDSGSESSAAATSAAATTSAAVSSVPIASSVASSAPSSAPVSSAPESSKVPVGTGTSKTATGTGSPSSPSSSATHVPPVSGAAAMGSIGGLAMLALGALAL